jgi:hypothetical protein
MMSLMRLDTPRGVIAVVRIVTTAWSAGVGLVDARRIESVTRPRRIAVPLMWRAARPIV